MAKELSFMPPNFYRPGYAPVQPPWLQRADSLDITEGERLRNGAHID